MPSGREVEERRAAEERQRIVREIIEGKKAEIALLTSQLAEAQEDVRVHGGGERVAADATPPFEADDEGLKPPPARGTARGAREAKKLADDGNRADPIARLRNSPPQKLSEHKTWCGEIGRARRRMSGSAARLLKAGAAVLMVLLLTVLGGVIFAHLEGPAEEAERAKYQTFLRKVRQSNLADEDFDTLCGYLGTPLETEGSEVQGQWTFPHDVLFLHCFSIISTIGYGNIAPATDGGKIVTIIYALFGIPITLSAVGICASELLYLFEYLAVARMDQVKEAFDHYDLDHSDRLDLQEFRAALHDLGITLSDLEFDQLVKEIDDGDGEIDRAEFKATTAALSLPVGKAARTKYRLYITVIVNILWLLMGMVVMGALEGWTMVDSLYFCVVTLTTVGLGDYVPATPQGIKTGFFYCMVRDRLSQSPWPPDQERLFTCCYPVLLQVGLGLLALLITAIGDFVDGVRQEALYRAQRGLEHATATLTGQKDEHLTTRNDPAQDTDSRGVSKFSMSASAPGDEQLRP